MSETVKLMRITASESAPIFHMTLPCCVLTVISLMPRSKPICLFNRPVTTLAVTACSRRLLVQQAG
ncbi:MAG: hypothetical protein V7604_4389 [Hyphomicrobiales bacterium]|jgi:hypothetical protein